MSYQSPLSKARGLGSAKSGVHHWWVQRVTSALLVPLTLIVVFAFACLGNVDHANFVAFVQNPFIAVTIIVMAIVLFYHSALGIQVVAEDYVSGKFARIALMTFVNLSHLVLAVVTAFAVLKIAFGS